MTTLPFPFTSEYPKVRIISLSVHTFSVVCLQQLLLFLLLLAKKDASIFVLARVNETQFSREKSRSEELCMCPIFFLSGCMWTLSMGSLINLVPILYTRQKKRAERDHLLLQEHGIRRARQLRFLAIKEVGYHIHIFF